MVSLDFDVSEFEERMEAIVEDFCSATPTLPSTIASATSKFALSETVCNLLPQGAAPQLAGRPTAALLH